MVQKSEFPFNEQTDTPNLAEATNRLAEVTAKARRIVEQRKTGGLVKSGARKSIVSAKRSVKKVAMKSTKKATTRVGTKKRSTVKPRRQNRASNQ